MNTVGILDTKPPGFCQRCRKVITTPINPADENYWVDPMLSKYCYWCAHSPAVVRIAGVASMYYRKRKRRAPNTIDLDR